MIFGLIKDKPLLDEESILWLFAIFEWSLRNFNAGVFYREAILVKPTNEHFPGRVNSVHGMASLVFEKVKSYAGMQHWPFQLVDNFSCTLEARPQVKIEGMLRDSRGLPPAAGQTGQLTVTYDPNQINDPEALIATFAHALAHYLGPMAKEPPPGGVENWPQVTEILAVFMGFGLMFANSAFTFRRGGCGSCRPPPVGRSNSLSQYYSSYALALFCVLKDIPNSKVIPHLKKSLRSDFRKSVKDVRKRTDLLDKLRSYGEAELKQA